MTEDANTERMIAAGWLFRCEVCGGIGDWVCDCPDGEPTTTLADAARVARKAAQSSEAPSPQSEAKPSAGNLPQDEPNYKALYTELKGERDGSSGGRVQAAPDGATEALSVAGWEPFTLADERFLDPGVEVLVSFKVQRGARNDYRGLYYILGDDPLEDPNEGEDWQRKPPILTRRIVAIRRGG